MTQGRVLEILNNFKNWLFWWSLDKTILKLQIEQYATLPMSKSARGKAAIFLLLIPLFSIVIFVLEYIFSDTFERLIFILSGVAQLFIIIPPIMILGIIVLFVYSGDKLTMLITMILITLGSIFFSLIIGWFFSIFIITWWVFSMNSLWMAYRIEKIRDRQGPIY